MPSQQLIIVGAGIGGLATALALAQKDFNVLVLERAPELSELGAGLQLSPNSTSVLKKLNVLDGVKLALGSQIF